MDLVEGITRGKIKRNKTWNGKFESSFSWNALSGEQCIEQTLAG